MGSVRTALRALGIGVLSLALVTGVAACGSGAAGDADGGDVVSVAHKFGTSEVPVQPERVVTLSAQWLDAVLAFDIQPVAFARDALAGDDGLYDWQVEHLDGATPLTATEATGLPLEQIAALDPDLILADYSASEQSVYDQLDAIAPTLGLLGDEQVDRWESQVGVIGEIFGRFDDAEAIIERVRSAVADTAAELPGLEGKTAVLSQFMFDGNQIVAVADPDDGAAALFYDLGMSWPEHVVTEAAGAGRVFVSAERVDILRSDLLIMWPNGGEPDDLLRLPGFAELPAVQSGAFAAVDVETVVALNTPSALSIEWVLDSLRPELECAAGNC